MKPRPYTKIRKIAVTHSREFRLRFKSSSWNVKAVALVSCLYHPKKRMLMNRSNDTQYPPIEIYDFMAMKKKGWKEVQAIVMEGKVACVASKPILVREEE